MSQASPRIKLFMYNFGLVLSLKRENEVFKVSNCSAFFNLFKVPIVIFITIFAFAFPPLRDAIVLDTLMDLKDFSVFAIFSINITVAIVYTGLILLSLLQVKRRHQMCSFVNNWTQTFLEESFLLQFEKDCKTYSRWLVFVFLIISTIQYLGATKVSIPSFAFNFVFMFPNLVFFSVVSFVTSFESFIAASLNEFDRDLKEFSYQTSTQKEVKFKNHLKLAKKYQNIYNLVEQFNNCFGTQLTLVTCHFTLMLIFGVRECSSVQRSLFNLIAFTILVFQQHSVFA